MSLQTICDVWLTELSAVTGLTTALTHRYASWSLEQLAAGTNERHLAVWPEADFETSEGLTTAPARLLTQSFVVLIWEEAASEATRLYDDDTANAAWLALAEAVRARFHVTANRALGDTNIMDTTYTNGTFGLRGAVRYIEEHFVVRLPISFT